MDDKGAIKPNPDDEATSKRLKLEKEKRKEAGDVSKK